MNDDTRLTWVRASEPDHFLALDGDVEVGVVKWVETGPDHGWFWSMLATAPGPAFKRPTSGQCATRGLAARELGTCWSAFRGYYGLDEEGRR